MMTGQDYTKLVKTWFEFESLFCKSSDSFNAYNIIVFFTFSHPGATGFKCFLIAAVVT